MNYSPFQIEPSWEAELREELSQPYLIDLASFVEDERSRYDVFPPKDLMFNAFQQTPYEKVKVVIVGQDPYHGPGQAHGLSFSVPMGVPTPPSLKNIYKEIHDDLGYPVPEHGCLLDWAKQGVLLLNTALTVRKSEAHSHKNKGWERFTDAAIAAIYKREKPVVFLLWGRAAQEKCQHLKMGANHLILKAAHPSPLSAYNGFFGCKHFSKANEQLKQWGEEPIDWSLTQAAHTTGRW